MTYFRKGLIGLVGGAAVISEAKIFVGFHPAATDKILQVAKTWRTAIEQPTKFELIVSAKSQKHGVLKLPP
jgi:hypothetical protein